MTEPHTITRLEGCARCDGVHENLMVQPFTRPPERWTHWGLCPTNGEPILVHVTTED